MKTGFEDLGVVKQLHKANHLVSHIGEQSIFVAAFYQFLAVLFFFFLADVVIVQRGDLGGIYPVDCLSPLPQLLVDILPLGVFDDCSLLLLSSHMDKVLE